MKWRRGTLGLTVVLALAAAACSDGTESSPGDEITETGPAATAEPDVEPTTTEAASDASLVVGANEIENWDPAATANAPISGRWMDPVYDPLIVLEQDGSYVPALAESWEFVNDGSALRLVLREDVVFHDETPFNADAVKQNIDRNLAGASVVSQMTGITGATVVDEYTVDVELEPGTGISVLYGLSQTPGRMVSPAAFDSAATNPVGTGPFTFVEFSGNTATFERNDDYWATPPAYQTLTVQALGAGNTEWINAIIAGDIDVGRLPAPSEAELAQVEAADGVVVEPAPVGGFFDYVGFNRTRAPFDDVRVREAVMHSLDFEAINAAIGHVVTHQFAAPSSAIHADGVDADYTYDPERSTELLAEAGYPDGFDIEMVTTTFGTLPTLSQIVQESLAAIAINAEIRVFDGAAEITEYCFESRPDGCDMSTYTTSTREPLFLLTRMLTAERDTHNLGNTQPEGTLNDFWQEATVATDVSSYEEALSALLREMHGEQITHLVVGMAPAYVMYREGIEGVTETMTVELYPQYEALVPAE